MEIKYYLRTVLHGWWLILLTMLLALQVTLVADYLATPIYQASATFAISPNITTLESASQVLDSLDTLDNRSVVTTYAEFLNSDRLYNETLKSLNIDPGSLVDYTRTTTVITDSNVLEFTVEGTDPNTVAILANTVSEHAVAAIQELYSAYSISMLDPAVASEKPIRPAPMRDAGVALGLGFVLGCGLALLKAQIQTSLDTFQQKSNLDKVSQAFNRRYLERRLAQELTHNSENALSFGLIQLEGLQGAIDNLPENLVQELLRSVTQTFQKELRGNDMISRWDDITYAILLPSTSSEAANRTINRICNEISRPVDLKDYGEKINLKPFLSVTTSKNGETFQQFISRTQDMLKSMVIDTHDSSEIQPKTENQNN